MESSRELMRVREVLERAPGPAILRPCRRCGRRFSYGEWSATCDTLHAHTQVLGKLAVALAPPEPQLQHAALRLTARGWETLPLPAPDGSGALVVALDLRSPRGGRRAQRRARAARRADARPPGRRGHARGARRRSARLAGAGRDRPDAAGGAVERAARRGRRARDATTPSRSPPTSPRRPGRRSCWPRSARPTAAARRRSTRGGARSTSPSACSPGCRPSPRRTTSSCATRWTPRRSRSAGGPATRATARRRSTPTPTRRPTGSPAATLSPPAARWDAALGEYILDWDDVRASPDPHAFALEFARSAFRHACLVCEWDPALAASAEGAAADRLRREQSLGGVDRRRDNPWGDVHVASEQLLPCEYRPARPLLQAGRV